MRSNAAGGGSGRGERCIGVRAGRWHEAGGAEVSGAVAVGAYEYVQQRGTCSGET